MGFPVQLLLFINKLCTGRISRHQARCGTFWLHWSHSPANIWSREITLTSQNIGWRLNSSILHHLLMQKNKYLCTEQVTSNNDHHGRLTSNPHWPCECTCYEADSSIKLKSSRSRHFPKSSDDSRYYLVCYVRHMPSPVCPRFKESTKFNSNTTTYAQNAFLCI